MSNFNVPTVAPDTAPQAAPQINAPAGAFAANVLGAGAADVAQGLGVTASELDKHVQEFQAVNNKVEADTASVKAVTALDTMRSEYQANNTGLAAYQNLGDFYKNLEDTRTQFGSNLSPLAQEDFDSATRRYVANIQSEVTSFAVGQRKAAVLGSLDGNIKLAAATAVSQPNNPDAQAGFSLVLGTNLAAMAKPENLGLTPQEASLKALTYTSPVYAAQAKLALDGQDLDGAKAIVAAHRDDMTPEALTGVMGAIKTADTADSAAKVGNAIYNGGAAVKPGAPQGAWDSGATLIKGNPASVLQGLVGVPVTITSDARTPAQNAAVGGSPTSEHLTGNAWDFVPQGKSLISAASTLAANLTAQGIPYDQIEVDPTNGHVHVGFGEQNRNEVIDQTGKVLSRTPPPLNAAFAPIPKPGPGTDANEYVAQTDPLLLARANAAFPDNPTMAERALQFAVRQRNFDVAALKASQDSTADNFRNMILNNQTQSVTALQQADPTGWASLPPQAKTQLNAMTQANAKEVTPARQVNIWKLNGEFATSGQDPSPFLAEDINSMDLPLGQQTQFLKMQDQVRAKANAQGLDTPTSKALSSITAQQALSSLNLTKKDNPDGYYTFAGQLHDSIQSFMDGHGGAAPAQPDIDKMIVSVTAQQKADPGAVNPPIQRAAVPPGDRLLIQQAYARAHGGAEPTESTIQARYNALHGAQ